MSVTTYDYAKIGTEAYRATIGRDDGTYLETIESKDFSIVEGAKWWALARIEALGASSETCTYDATIERIRWIESVYPDSEFGLVRDAVTERDETFLLLCSGHGRGWRDRHLSGSPRWELM